MGLKVFGLGAVQSVDKQGELIEIANIDTSNLRMITDEHNSDQKGAWCIVGGITGHKKILSEKDCETPRQKKCWDLVKVPYLYVEGELADGHPNADAAAALIRYTAANPDIPLKIGMSIEGLILKRGGPEGSQEHKVIKQSSADAIAITAKPCNPQAQMFPMNDLMKSSIEPPPAEYLQKFIKSEGATESFKHRPEIRLQQKLQELKKSLEDVLKGGTCSVKCWSCGDTERMFKASREWSNRCKKCGDARSMQDIWNALNQ